VDLKAVKPPPKKKASAEITTLDSTGFFREFMSSWGDGGEPTFMAYYSTAQFATLDDMLDDGDNWYWRIVFPLITGQSTNARINFVGHLTESAVEEATTDDDGKFMVAFTIRTTGRPTFTAAT